MELVVVRHAIAEDRAVFARTGKDDAERPLTADGRRRFEAGARGLRRVAGDVDLLVTSPLVRARETADLVASACRGELRRLERPELAPEADPAALLRWLGGQRVGRVAVVGHEPHLSALVAHAVGARRPDAFVLKKGGACLLELGTPARAGGRATLRWMLTAAQLRKLGR